MAETTEDAGAAAPETEPKPAPKPRTRRRPPPEKPTRTPVFWALARENSATKKMERCTIHQEGRREQHFYLPPADGEHAPEHFYDTIKQVFGSGRYRVTLHQAKGRTKINQLTIIEIDDPEHPPLPLYAGAPAASYSDAAPPHARAQRPEAPEPPPAPPPPAAPAMPANDALAFILQANADAQRGAERTLDRERERDRQRHELELAQVNLQAERARADAEARVASEQIRSDHMVRMMQSNHEQQLKQQAAMSSAMLELVADSSGNDEPTMGEQMAQRLADAMTPETVNGFAAMLMSKMAGSGGAMIQQAQTAQTQPPPTDDEDGEEEEGPEDE